MTMQKLAGPARILSVMLLGASFWGCAQDSLVSEPELSATNAKAVSPQPKPAVFTFPSSGYSVTNDGNSVYTNGDCNVTAKTFIDTDGTEDGNMQMDAPGNKVKCKRTVVITYADGAIDHVTGMNVNDIGSVSDIALRTMNFAIASATKCSRIGFGNEVNPAGAKVTVTRGATVNGKRAWNVSFQGDGTCVTTQGALIPVALTLNFDIADL